MAGIRQRLDHALLEQLILLIWNMLEENYEQSSKENRTYGTTRGDLCDGQLLLF
jgi:hypothetical protein